MKILVANVGSTSFKFKLYQMGNETILAQGKIENIGRPTSKISLTAGTAKVKTETGLDGYKGAISFCISYLIDNGVLADLAELNAVGFKTVHGKGMRECRVLDELVLSAMADYNFLAPAHNPAYINAIRIFQDLAPNVPCVGLFEPAFHHTIPDYAYISGLPLELAEKHGIRKYGFHGASHRYISERAPVYAGLDPKNSRIISCHLGGSSSMCAIKNGESIDTTMAFSPQSGLLNATRCGDLDPFIPLFLQKAENMSVDQVSDLLQSESGLTGIAGDNKDVLQIELDALKGDERSLLAMRTYCYRVKLYIGAYYAALGGCDLLVFTGGIGENSDVFRNEICTGLECIGIHLDDTKNANSRGEEALISTVKSQMKIAVVPTNEELVVARQVAKLLNSLN